ncbi:MAG TPA: hypothetical protein VG323_22770 [Thermoanaerobaculia bacterium]|nr:hypothetical protein [Thermoanaerobaculia bacterium]
MRTASAVSFLLVLVAAAASADTFVKLNLELSRAGLLTVSKLSNEPGPVPTARVAMDKGKAVYAKANMLGNTMTLELVERPPAGTKSVMLPKDVALDDEGVCSLAHGTYNIDFMRVKAGEVKVPVVVNAALEVASHRKRRSRA